MESRPDFQLGVKRLYIELTNTCNFRCDFCPISVSKRPKSHMPWERYTRIINQVVDEGLTRRIALHVLGEPLLHRRVVDAVDYAKRKGLGIVLTTNGSLLTPELVRSLAGSGLDELDISLETIDPEQHAARNAPLSFPDYYATILQAVRTARSFPEMSLRLNLMNTFSSKIFTVHKAMRIKKQGAEYRVSLRQLILDICAAIGLDKDPQAVDSVLRRTNLNKPMRIRLDHQVNIYVQVFMDWGNAFNTRKTHPARIGFCNYAIRYPAILSDGTVTVCCGDFDGVTALGNVEDSSLSGILSSKAARHVDEGFRKCRVRHPHCQKCLGSGSRIVAWLKGLGSIYTFKRMPAQTEDGLWLS